MDFCEKLDERLVEQLHVCIAYLTSEELKVRFTLSGIQCLYGLSKPLSGCVCGSRVTLLVVDLLESINIAA